MEIRRSDFLVIGAGLAGLAFALKASVRGTVTILTKERIDSANTPRAQGGIAAVVGKDDTFASHVHDTMRAGAGLCHDDVVQNFVEQAPQRIEDLELWGVQFDTKTADGEVDLTREGGHSHRRILHFEDHTGGEIHRALVERCRQHPNITLLEDQFAIDLILNKHLQSFDTRPSQCFGAYVLDRSTRKVSAFLAGETILSTGGAGKVYLYTSNWSGASGDGLAMAWRAGARVANLEFMQFHPTCLFHPSTRNFLISEALRGEGGELINAKGEEFMKRYSEMGSLAPRDIVARSIDAEMKKTGADCVYLDMTRLAPDFVRSRFPAIAQKCLELGLDITQNPIPVVPAAHYLCGGVVTDVNGQTDLRGLWALGETACTGFHGANRLASNSLLECLTMAHNCWKQLENVELPKPEGQPRQWIYPPPTNEDEMIVITHMWEEIRRLMWNYVGIVRTNKRLERASHRLKNILSEVKEYYSNFNINGDILELRNIAIVADLSVECALRRRESRGIHYNLDYAWAQPDSVGEDTVLTPGRL